MTKICKRCGVRKPLDEFHRNSSSKDGRRAVCKACEQKRERAAAVVAVEPDDPLEPLVLKQGEVYRRPAWHEWVYGGGRNPLLEVRHVR